MNISAAQFREVGPEVERLRRGLEQAQRHADTLDHSFGNEQDRAEKAEGKLAEVRAEIETRREWAIEYAKAAQVEGRQAKATLAEIKERLYDLPRWTPSDVEGGLEPDSLGPVIKVADPFDALAAPTQPNCSEDQGDGR
jgi:chromosome segregation ATPase